MNSISGLEHKIAFYSLPWMQNGKTKPSIINISVLTNEVCPFYQGHVPSRSEISADAPSAARLHFRASSPQHSLDNSSYLNL